MKQIIVDYYDFKREKYLAEKYYHVFIFYEDNSIYEDYFNKIEILEYQDKGFKYKNKNWFTEKEFKKMINKNLK